MNRVGWTELKVRRSFGRSVSPSARRFRLRCRSRTVARLLAVSTLTFVPGCFTFAALDACTEQSELGPSSWSGGGDAVGVAVGLCAPCVVPLIIIPIAVALDVVTFPVQVAFGYYPYGARGKVTTSPSDDEPTLPQFGTDTGLEERR